MSEKFIAAMVQTRTRLSPDDNVKEISALIREAKAKGAAYVQTPEMTNLLAANRDQLFKIIADEEHDSSLMSFRALARELKIYLHVGSMAVRATPDRAANRAFLIDPNGEIIARYDKIHMFDVNLANGESYRESNSYQPGDTAALADLPWGRIGLTICYDMRFPSLYRALAESGASFLTMPSAFTKPTGEAHWHVLLRSRAIENGAFVFAAAQGGVHESKRITYGHSLIIDPWGEILAEGGIDPGVITAEIDPAKVADARGKIPSLQHGRRFSVPEASAGHLHVVRNQR
jgi:deaminated glutathione amidase